MNNKRNLLPDVFKSRKKIYRRRSVEWKREETSPDLSNDARAAFLLLHSSFPLEKFEHRLPPIIFKHQLYSINKNKTETDRQLNELRNLGEIRFFHLGIAADDLCIVLRDDYVKHVRSLNGNNPVVDEFLNIVCNKCSDIFLSREILASFNFGDEEIAKLFKAGVLTVRDVGSWWIAIPGAGEFMKCFIRGRKALLMMIKKSKYGEVLQTELESRKLPKIAKLGILYHIHDIVGAEMINCVNTTSGRLLREKN